MTENRQPSELPVAAPPSQTRRTLLKAGWVAPVVVVLSLPAVSFDANASGGAQPIQPTPYQPPRVTLPPTPPWWWPRFLPWPPFGG
jgi:hypothetical protein